MATFQILGILFAHPLARCPQQHSASRCVSNPHDFCSVDLYVVDKGWFCRHHYLFMTMLRVSEWTDT